MEEARSLHRNDEMSGRDETIGDVKTNGSEFSAVCGHSLLSYLHEARQAYVCGARRVY